MCLDGSWRVDSRKTPRSPIGYQRGIPINIVEVTTKEWQSTSLDGGDATTIKDTTEIIIDGGKVGTEDWASGPTENGSGAL